MQAESTMQASEPAAAAAAAEAVRAEPPQQQQQEQQEAGEHVEPLKPLEPLDALQEQEKRTLLEAYADFWRNTAFSKGYNAPRCSKEDIDALLDEAADYVVRIRGEAPPGGSPLRVPEGSAYEMLWNLDHHPNSAPAAFVLELVRATLSSGGRLQCGLSDADVERRVGQLRGRRALGPTAAETLREARQQCAAALEAIRGAEDAAAAAPGARDGPCHRLYARKILDSARSLAGEVQRLLALGDQRHTRLLRQSAQLSAIASAAAAAAASAASAHQSQQHQQHGGSDSDSDSDSDARMLVDEAPAPQAPAPAPAAAEAPASPADKPPAAADTAPAPGQAAPPPAAAAAPAAPAAPAPAADGVSQGDAAAPAPSAAAPQAEDTAAPMAVDDSTPAPAAAPAIATATAEPPQQQQQQPGEEHEAEEMKVDTATAAPSSSGNAEERKGDKGPEEEKGVVAAAAAAAAAAAPKADETTVLQIRRITEDMGRLRDKISEFANSAELTDLESLTQSNPVDGVKKIERLQKRCREYSEYLMRGLLDLDGVPARTDDARALRKAQVIEVQKLMEGMDAITDRLAEIRGQIQAEADKALEEQQQQRQQEEEEQQQQQQQLQLQLQQQQQESKAAETARRRQEAARAQWAEQRRRLPWDKVRLSPKVNVNQERGSYVITAVVPGLDRETIRVDVTPDGGALLVEGMRQPTAQELDQLERIAQAHPALRRLDRSAAVLQAGAGRYGKFSRQFQLPDDVDVQAISGTYDNGLLKIVLPRLAPRLPVFGGLGPYGAPASAAAPGFFGDRDLWW
eukprot:m51a1_g5035 hypothetical protein (799) ;mRNA; f:373864-376541